ncbi:MAG TPA: ABC transporter permease subunit [Myxococcales bacterium]|nr:ABC transporter permease subunit [Myxococcales bacterium]
MRAALAIVEKELLELRRSPLLIASMLSLPAAVVAVPLLLLAYLARAAPDQAVDFLRELYQMPESSSRVAALAAVLARQWLPLFLVLPIFLPILIAAQSIGGERERHTLEPLLATPVSTLSIVAGKSVAAVAPSLLITWLSALVFCGGVDLIVWPSLHRPLLPDFSWLFGTLVLCPLLALFGNATAVVVSARVLDPRAAQNIAAMTVVPLLGLLVVQLAGRVSLSAHFYGAFALLAALADVLLVALAVKLFDRDALLTRWR